MRIIRYWFGDDDFEFELSNYDLRTFIKTRLSDYDKKSLIEFIVENVSDDDLYYCFEEELKEHYENNAYEIYKQRR